MSKANNPIKVLRTALKRVTKGWTKGAWNRRGPDGNHYVCLEGAIYGFCNQNDHKPTNAQLEAIYVIETIIEERTGRRSIPGFNDEQKTTKEDIQEVIKLGIIRLETGWEDGDDEALTEEETDDLLEFINNKD